MTIAEITEATQHLTFKLDEEIFALDISKVREVLEFTTVTKVPQTPDFMCGVINLRGGVVPVVDLRLKFGMPVAEKTVNTCIIIVEVSLDGETTVLGALADSVQEVLELEPDQIEPAPKIGTRLKTDFIKGMGKRDDQFIMILDIDKVFSSDELAIVQDAGGYATAEEAETEAGRRGDGETGISRRV
ncbi:MAG TPA: chemotaxis protein CheW [Nitrospirae bacterium]|nr:chemotaxis protein CheW [bacterium BMS3Abin06]HDH11212.1 chemotaxis protein CheW [Nitrospirota bacterium]HDZ02453.1 chemotaxis protein CheW [Nitrospirota bacterium]